MTSQEKRHLILNNGDRIGIIGCSNGIRSEARWQLEQLQGILMQMGLVPVLSPYLFREGYETSTERQRAEALMDCYRDERVTAIFDISGGDLANGVLDYLDYERIQNTPKSMFGYSDLTTVLNAIYQKTGQKGYLYQLRNLVSDNGIMQHMRFSNSLFQGKLDLYQIHWHWIQNISMEGIVVGGNLRCLLKLAGTEYFPNMKDKLLFLESRSGNIEFIASCFTQLKQMGVFKQIKGLLLGTFSQLDEQWGSFMAEKIALQVLNDRLLPVARTMEVGHGTDSKCLIIGEYYKIR